MRGLENINGFDSNSHGMRRIDLKVVAADLSVAGSIILRRKNRWTAITSNTAVYFREMVVTLNAAKV